MNKVEQIGATKDKLGQVSCSFCLAKWKQVTIHLQNGMTHSCHHPIPHKIPLAEIKGNPSALHNTDFKKKQRMMMLNGQRPKECHYCWDVEDAPGENVSDRYIKSSDDWAAPHFDTIKKLNGSENVNPSYLEVSFSNACNFKCAYCSPQISSKWMEEIKQLGPYPTQKLHQGLHILERYDLMPYASEAPNPYIDAFWEWWPELYKDLQVFRITGGEPLLSRNTFRVIDWLIANPSPNLEFSINTNLGVPRPILERFSTAIAPLINDNKVKKLTLFTSADAFGEPAEYIRYGMNYDEFINNVEFLCEQHPQIHIVIMCTFNVMSVVSLEGLLHEVVRLKQKYMSDRREAGRAISIDISHIHEPPFFSPKLVGPDYLSYFENYLILMNSMSEGFLGRGRGFDAVEISKMQRLRNWMTVQPSRLWLEINRLELFKFINEYDRRRNLNFEKVFPQLDKFWGECKENYFRSRGLPPSTNQGLI